MNAQEGIETGGRAHRPAPTGLNCGNQMNAGEGIGTPSWARRWQLRLGAVRPMTDGLR